MAHVILVNGADRSRGGRAARVTLLPKTREEAREAMDAHARARAPPRVPAFMLDDLVRRAPTSPLARLMAEPTQELERFLLDDRLVQLGVPVTMIWGEDDRCCR